MEAADSREDDAAVDPDTVRRRVNSEENIRKRKHAEKGNTNAMS